MSEVSGLLLNYSSSYFSSVTSLQTLYKRTLGSHIFKSVCAAAVKFPGHEELAGHFRCFLAFWNTLHCLQYNRAICYRNTSKKVRFSAGVTPEASRDWAVKGVWLNTTYLIRSQTRVCSIILQMSHVSERTAARRVRGEQRAEAGRIPHVSLCQQASPTDTTQQQDANCCLRDRLPLIKVMLPGSS